MAKRSDFAQKLLDDLRMRKERMAASSHDQRSNKSNHLPIDAYAYTKQTYRGPRNAKANEIVGSRSGEMMNRCGSNNSSRRHRSVNNGELSNQIIIPYGKGGQSQIESQALAFAFENGGKHLRRADLSYTNSIMGFLHQITKRERGSNLDRQLPSTSSSHYSYPPPTSSTVSLVQINDISKGAQKLNHILRACSSNGLNMDTYSLQVAKELLQGAIDLEDSLRMLLLVDLQKNSDQFMITSQQQAKNNNRITLLEEDTDDEEEDERRMQRKMQLARPSFSFGNMIQRPITVTNSKEARKIKSNRSSSSGLADISKQTACKGRIPNVIAKLMGLEDNLPLPEENKVKKKDSSSNSKHTAKAKAAKGSSSFSTIVLKNKQSDDNLMKKQDDHPNNSTNREQKGTVKGRTNDPPLLNLNTNMLKLEQQVLRERSQVKSSIQVVRETNAGIIIQPEKGHNTLTNKHVLSNDKKSKDHHQVGGVQKSCPYALSKNMPQEEQTLMRRRRRMRAHEGRGSEMTMTPKNSSSKPSSPQKKQPSINNLNTNHDLVKDEAASNDTNGNNIVKEISSPRDQEFERAKGRRHGIKTMKDDKHVQKLVLSKKTKQKIDPMLTARNGQGKQQILPNLRDRAYGKLNGGAVQEADAPINELPQLPPPTLYSSGGGGEFQSPHDLVHYQEVQSVAVNLLDQATPGAVDYGIKTGDGEVALRKTNGTRKDGMGVNHSKISIQQPLTESENCLKWILVMSQLFVNTAEALFRLNIPFSVLQSGHQVQDNQDQGSKLTLDCGYEVMKRKGIRQELKVHNCSNISSISTVNIIRSLDDLVRKLNEDMEKLKFYGRRKGTSTTQVDLEEYLPEMLEHDVYDKYPDINCMWDFGWNDETFAFIEKYDVIRDTEKHILSVLLDEITKDCCMLLFNEEED